MMKKRMKRWTIWASGCGLMFLIYWKMERLCPVCGCFCFLFWLVLSCFGAFCSGLTRFDLVLLRFDRFCKLEFLRSSILDFLRGDVVVNRNAMANGWFCTRFLKF